MISLFPPFSFKNFHELALRSKLFRLLDGISELHEPVLITGKRNKPVLIAEEDWSAIQETLFLLSVPGMRKAIKEGVATSVSECDEELKW